MGDLRHDPLTGSATIVAGGRAARPDTHRAPVRAPLPAQVADCPFCPGNEHATPPEVARRGSGAPDTPGWRIRVVPNLYPVVDAGDGDGPPGPAASSATAGSDHVHGAHEVVVMSPDHDRDLGALDDDEAVELFAVLRDRSATHAGGGCAHVSLFVNQGRAGGASIEHPHAQVIAVDRVPPDVAAAEARFRAARRDPVAEQIVDARARGLVVLDGPAPVWCPWAASWPYEMVVAHRSTRARVDDASDVELTAVAHATRDAVRALVALLGAVPYNVLVSQAPTVGPSDHHWHVRIVPRTVVRAGFELTTGFAVNDVPPEIAVARLRHAAGGAEA